MSLGIPIANAVQINGEVPGFMNVDSVMAPIVGTPYSRLQNLMKTVYTTQLVKIENLNIVRN